jgi:putative transport protein
VGDGFVVWFLASLAPRLLRVDLKAESRKLEGRAVEGSKHDRDTRPAYREWDVRAYRVPPALAERTVAEVERSFAPERVFVQRIRRGPALVDAAPDTVLRRGDVAVFTARRPVLLAAGSPFGEEVEDRDLLDFPMAVLDVVVTRKEIADRTVAEVAEAHGRGVVLLKLVRAAQEIPFAADTILNRGDLLQLAGPQAEVERAGRALGYVERPSSETDVVFVGLGILIGGLVGALTVKSATCPSA